MSFINSSSVFFGVLAAFTPVWICLGLILIVSRTGRHHLGFYGRLFDNPIGVAGFILVVFWLLTAIFADLITSFGPLEQFAQIRRKGPGVIETQSGLPFYFGADNLGRDLFSRMIYGSRFVLIIAPAATMIAFMIGAVLGLPAGFYGGRIDTALSFIANLVLAFPVILLFYLLVTPGIRETIIPVAMAAVLFLFPLVLIALVLWTRYGLRRSLFLIQISVLIVVGGWLYCGLVFRSFPYPIIQLDPNELNIFAAVVFASSPAIFRIIRGLTLDIKIRDYIAAAETRGESPWYIMLWEVLPNARGPLIVDFSLRVGYTTILLGTLGFFGLGLAPESPDWGSMINQTRPFIRIAPTMVIPPTLALASLVLGLTLLADGLRETALKD